MRFFNTAGPIDPKRHYYVPHRLNEIELQQLIEQQKYFILHAPRQSGKTTAMRIFVDQLNATKKYKALYFNVEPAQIARGDVEKGMEIILGELRGQAKIMYHHNDPVFAIIEKALERISGGSLKEALQNWSNSSNQPILLFIDEIDSLVGDTLISVLRQLRAGYTNRPQYFPQSVCLIGVRDVRDYRIWSESEHHAVLGGSAFNIKAESLILPNFSLQQVRDLYLQHTHETGQKFTDEAIDYAFYLTQGQPWLVNALAYQACFRDVTDRNQPITKDVIERAKDTLILRRDTHIDQLVHKLHEPRVRHIIDTILSGMGQEETFATDDLQYVRDLGLITQTGIKIANPIYQEIIPRELVYTDQESMKETVSDRLSYQNEDGSLNTHKLLEEFTKFYRENSDIWLEKFDYKESGPHLLLMAYLQRVVNGLPFEALAKEGGGRIHREYALGRKRVDVLVEFGLTLPKEKQQRIVIELKIKRGEKTIPEGLEQTAHYRDINNATEGHLIVFDRDPNKSWNEKISTQEMSFDKHKITVWRM